MLLLAALASTIDPVPDTRVTVQATVRIMRRVQVVRKQWEQLPPSRRREKIVVDGGRQILLRLIEME
ncbi:MAG TPA: hypothetical protein VFZ88_11990 [Sphingomicrobium sp.]